MYVIYVRRVTVYHDFLLSTNKLSILNFKVDIDVQITILKFRK